MKVDPIMRGMLSSRKSDGRIGQAWLMARASFAHSYGYDCGFWYSLRGALRLFIEYVRRPS